MTGPVGGIGPEPAPAAAPTDLDARTGVPCPGTNPAPDRSLSRERWSERDRRVPEDGVLAPQRRYPGRIATP